MSRLHAYAVDQGLSSAANFATLMLAATVLDGDEFGAFALGASLFGLVLGVARATSSERIAAAASADARTPVLTTSTVLLVAVSVALATALALVTGRAVVITWAAAGPLTLLQDRLRFVALRDRPLAAVYSDAVWLGLTVVGWVVSFWMDLSAIAATSLLAIPGPLVGSIVLVLAVPACIEFRVSADVRATIAELRFVADSWLQSAAVFVSLAIVAAVVSLTVAGRCRALMLIFQPFVSLAYAGRIGILTTSDRDRLRAWPRLLAVFAVAYGAFAGAAFAITRQVVAVPAVWSIGILPFVLMWAAQSVRAYHQGMVDVSRRGAGRGIVGPRVLFAVLMVASTAVAVPLIGFVGFAAAFVVSYLGAAVAAHLTLGRRDAARFLGQRV